MPLPRTAPLPPSPHTAPRTWENLAMGATASVDVIRSAGDILFTVMRLATGDKKEDGRYVRNKWVSKQGNTQRCAMDETTGRGVGRIPQFRWISMKSQPFCTNSPRATGAKADTAATRQAITNARNILRQSLRGVCVDVGAAEMISLDRRSPTALSDQIVETYSNFYGPLPPATSKQLPRIGHGHGVATAASTQQLRRTKGTPPRTCAVHHELPARMADVGDQGAAGQRSHDAGRLGMDHA